MEEERFALTVEQAMENIAIASEIEDPYRIGIFKNRLVVQEENSPYLAGVWLTNGSTQDFMEVLRSTFVCLTNYLKNLYKNPATDWNHESTRKGLQSMMVLVGVAAKKVNRAIKILEDKKKNSSNITKLPEYKILQEFYIDNITEKFANAPPQGDEAWQEDRDQSCPVKDLETIRKDDAYELFYLKNMDQQPLFKRSLIKNMRLLFDFSETIDLPLEDDPLLEIVTMKDRDLQGSSAQILQGMKPQITQFYQYKIRLKKNGLITALNSAIMSLMLASNEKNLVQNNFNKNCLKYFLDFQYFFREALNTNEYQKWISYPPKQEEEIPQFLLRFTHKLAYEFFTRSSSIRQEILGYIHRLIRKGRLLSEDKSIQNSCWQRILTENEHVETLLKRYPSGPLFKILDAIQEKQDQKFEPLQQENMPFLLFAMQIPDKTVHILHLPTPTRQLSLEKAEVAEEFTAFLAFLHQDCKKEKKHLLINLQDRTSWKESVRANVLENLQKRAEYSNNISVITLPKDTAFYHQKEEYETMDKASLFLETLEEQVTHPEDFGFFFGKDSKDAIGFFTELMRQIHVAVFNKKAKLTRQERCDFIEIFYILLTLKVMQDLQPNTISFTCKDALDVGAMMSAEFFAFLYLLKKRPLEKSQVDYLRLLIYAPVLMVRERSVDARRLLRALSALETFEKNITEKGLKKLESLYEKGFFQKISPI